MLTLKAQLNDLGHVSTNNPFVERSGSLHFFEHDLIVNSETFTDNVYEIWVGEDEDPFKAERLREIRHSKTRLIQNFDGVRVSLFLGVSGPHLTVSRSAAGTSPLYISVEASRVCLSWKFDEAVANLARPKANARLCRLVLKRGKGQSREQVIEGVYALWAGEEANVNNDGIHISDCEEISVYQPSSFADRARATDAFIETVASVIRPILTRARRPLLEFSGGMDSTCVALAASSVRTDLESFGVIHPGGVGRQQRARRQELIELLGLKDYTAASNFVLPVQSLLSDECQITPNDEVYRICMINALRENALSSSDVVISGLGGDELTKSETFGRWKWEVPGHVCASSIGGAMSHTDMYMRQGIWLLNPLCHPIVVNLCRAMPAEMRTNRLLHRMTMARAGLSDGYITPRLYETFASVLMLEAVEGDFEHFFNQSVLGDLGLIDISRLLSQLHKSSELGMPVKLVGKLYNTLKLEVILRKYLN